MPDGAYSGLSNGFISNPWFDPNEELAWDDTNTYVEIGNGNTMDRAMITALVNPSNYLQLSIEVNGVNELTICTDYPSLTGEREIKIPHIVTNVSVDSMEIRVYAKLIANGLSVEGEISLAVDVYELEVT
jgi:hypothetical protein